VVAVLHYLTPSSAAHRHVRSLLSRLRLSRLDTLADGISSAVVRVRTRGAHASTANARICLRLYTVVAARGGVLSRAGKAVPAAVEAVQVHLFHASPFFPRFTVEEPAWCHFPDALCRVGCCRQNGVFTIYTEWKYRFHRCAIRCPPEEEPPEEALRRHIFLHAPLLYFSRPLSSEYRDIRSPQR